MLGDSDANPSTKANLYLTMFGMFKVPLIWLCRPKLLALDDKHVELKIPKKTNEESLK